MAVTVDWERGACRVLARQLTEEVGALEAQQQVWAIFYPAVRRGATRRSHDAYKAARAVCAGCPLRDECLEDAIDNDDIRGVRAGLDPLQLGQLTGRSWRRIPA